VKESRSCTLACRVHDTYLHTGNQNLRVILFFYTSVKPVPVNKGGSPDVPGVNK
jgi:hypothetical protein